MNQSLRDLVALVPPADAGRRHHDWDGVRAALGTDIPPDFVELVDTYGSGQFDELLWIYEPGCVNRYLDFVAKARERQDAVDYFVEIGEPQAVPPSVVDGPDRLLVWGGDDYGNHCYWRCQPGVPPQRWPVMVDEEGGGDTWYEFDLTATEFLHQILTGQLSLDQFDRSLPETEHRFVPAPPTP
jgi:hypothetical protein